ncbi:MAG: hypothetical protein AVDCRST_MAG91-1456, partial [uncultured Sphingomonadaceae bacterium]
PRGLVIPERTLHTYAVVGHPVDHSRARVARGSGDPPSRRVGL